jgi:GTP-binding protein Era
MSKRRVPDDSGSAPFRCGQLAVIGRPNVGKSTLVNALVGARISITSNRPQTTRHRIRGILTTNRAQFIFVDTPGFQTAHRSTLNERMNRAVRESVTDVDAIVLVVEPSLTEGDRAVIALLPASVPAVVAVNKVDRLADKARLLPLLSEIAALREFAAIVPISAERSMELDLLLEEIERHLPLGSAQYPDDELTDRDERFLAAEFLREKIFRQLGEEVPYAAAVAIDSF